MSDATSPKGTPTATPASVPEAKAVRKARLSQEDVPGFPLDQALRVAQSIAENYAYSPTRPINVAAGMKVTPTSGFFRGVTGAAVAYGLTTGGYNAAEIGLTPLGLRIVRPTAEGDDLAAKREALLKPKTIGEFLRQYDGAALPTESIAKNVLVEKGVPTDRLDDVYKMITEGATAVGFIRDLSGKKFVDLTGASSPQSSGSGPSNGGSRAGAEEEELARSSPTLTPMPAQSQSSVPNVSMSAGVNINIEIHIAADASTQTIDDIFRSMRRYVLKPEDAPENEQ